MTRYPARVWAGLSAAVLFGLAGAVLFYVAADSLGRDAADYYKIGEQHARLAGVLEAIPPDATVGYISDVPFSKPEGQVYFFGVQYVLAPRLLVEETESRRQRWVLGSFLKRPDVARIERERGLRLVKSYGLGVYLFQRQP